MDENNVQNNDLDTLVASNWTKATPQQLAELERLGYVKTIEIEDYRRLSDLASRYKEVDDSYMYYSREEDNAIDRIRQLEEKKRSKRWIFALKSTKQEVEEELADLRETYQKYHELISNLLIEKSRRWKEMTAFGSTDGIFIGDFVQTGGVYSALTPKGKKYRKDYRDSHSSNSTSSHSSASRRKKGGMDVATASVGYDTFFG